jgi:hypothetical protein
MRLADRQDILAALLVERIGQDMDAQAGTPAARGDLMREDLEVLRRDRGGDQELRTFRA